MPTDKSTLQIAEEQRKLGDDFFNKAQFKEALSYYQEAAAKYWDLQEWQSSLRVTAKSVSCQIYLENYQMVLDETLNLLQIIVKRWDKEHVLSAHVYCMLGEIYLQMSDYQKVLTFHKKALVIRLKKLGNQHPDTAISYRETGIAYTYLGKFEEQIEYLKKALAIQRRVLGDAHEETGNTLHHLGMGYRVNSENEKAIGSLQQALKIHEQIYGEKHLSLAYDYRQLACPYMQKGDYERGLNYLQKALHLIRSLLGEGHSHIALLYTQFAWIYGNLGDHEQALIFLYKSLHIFQKNIGEENLNVAQTLVSIGESYVSKTEFIKAKPYLKRALIYFEEFAKEDIRSTAECCSRLGKVYLNLGQFPKALDYYLKSLNLNIEYFGKKHIQTILVYMNIGDYYNKCNQRQKALKYFEEGLQFQRSFTGEKHPITANLYANLVYSYQAPKDYSFALKLCQKALFSLSRQPVIQAPHAAINLEDYSNHLFLLEVLKIKAELVFRYFQLNTESFRDLQLAYSTYQSCIQVITQIKQSAQLDLSKFFLLRNNAFIYGKTLEVANILWNESNAFLDTQTLFDIVEKGKASLLLSSMQDNIAKAAAQIPQNLLQQEKQVKIELTYFEKKIQEEEIKLEGKKNNTIKEGGEKLQEYKSQYFDYQQEYNQLIQQFEQDYPDYYQLKYETKTSSIEELQESLTENQVMLNYFVGEKHYYLFFITSNDFEVYDFEKPDDFEQTVEEFLQAIQNHKLEAYTRTAYQLYLWLVKSVEIFIMDQFSDTSAFSNKNLALEATATELIIIPHGILNYVPFEALLCSPHTTSNTAENPYHSLDYLLLNCNVSYHYSATLWHYLLQSRGERATSNDSFVGFAPVYQSEARSESSEVEGGNKGEKSGVEENWTVAANGMRTWATRSEALRSDGSWTPLPHSKTEAQQIAALFDQKGYDNQTFLHDQATKTAFMEAAEKSRFVLIAAHGVVNDEQPKLSGLVFYPSSQPLSRSSTVDKVETPREETLATASRLANSWNGESSTDCILSMEEAYQLQLQADLVVLSSCESGIGTLAKGEGMMAVNRGFLYAGAKGVVSTLFKVYDEPSSRLTQYLFEGILEGAEATLALRAAKLRLLKEEKVDVKSWSGFVLIGG